MDHSRKLARFLITSLALGGGAVAVYATQIEPRRLRVRYVQVKLPRLPREFHDFRIAHISDLHMGEWMTPKRLQPTIDLMNELRPDAVAITGDFVSRHSLSVVDSLVEPLTVLRAPYGKFAVLGNHDYAYHVREVRSLLEQCGIIELRNRVHTLRRGDALLHMAGVDDVVRQQDSLDAVLEQLPSEGAAVLLAHEPDFADISAATGRFDLQLSGHTHGGQIWLPGIGAPLLPSYGKRYPAGLYPVGKMFQYTNPGLGMIAPFVRFNMPPELTILILEANR